MNCKAILFAVLICLFIGMPSSLHAQTDSLNLPVDSTATTQNFTKPRPFAFITKFPRTMQLSMKYAFSKKSVPGWLIMTGSTLALIAYDQKITDGVQQFSRYINLDNRNQYKTLIGFNIGKTHFDAYQLPQNLNSALYSLGEGSTSIFIAGGLSVYGRIAKDNRSRQTSSQILQSQLAVGVICQLLKRISGRESPDMATASGGVWRPITHGGFSQIGANLKDYQKHVSKHDAFPSGHFATMAATMVVLRHNYPEKKWIPPVGYSIMGITGLAMVNNGVHWAGDYPLAFCIGYVCGKASVMLDDYLKARKKKVRFAADPGGLK